MERLTARQAIKHADGTSHIVTYCHGHRYGPAAFPDKYGTSNPQEYENYCEMVDRLAIYEDIGTVEDFQRLKDEFCGAYPTTDLNIKPKCFYQETNHNRYCGALGRGENDDEPIEACKKCCHCEFNILREEAAEALAKEDAANDK